MAISTGGFWSSGFGQFLGGLLGPIASEALNREVTYNENDLNRMHDEYMALKNYGYERDLQRYQQEFEKSMSSSAYQRAVADMQAAGLNPASMAGSSAMQASTPASSAPNVSSHGSNALSYHTDNSFATSMITSAFNAVLAKDKQAAQIAGAELADNARHEHRLEEMREQWNYDVQRDALKYNLYTKR